MPWAFSGGVRDGGAGTEVAAGADSWAIETVIMYGVVSAMNSRLLLLLVVLLAMLLLLLLMYSTARLSERSST